MSKPSERMQHLIAALEASTIAGHDMHVNALKAAIAELEQRAQVLDDLAVIVRDHYADVTMPDSADHAHATSHDWVLCAINELGVQIKRAKKAEAERDVFEEHAAIQVHEIREWIERVNKWKRVAVARERCNQAIAAYNRAQIRGELLGDREDAWTKADLEFAEAVAELGKEWTEAVK